MENASHWADRETDIKNVQLEYVACCCADSYYTLNDATFQPRQSSTDDKDSGSVAQSILACQFSCQEHRMQRQASTCTRTTNIKMAV